MFRKFTKEEMQTLYTECKVNESSTVNDLLNAVGVHNCPMAVYFKSETLIPKTMLLREFVLEVPEVVPETIVVAEDVIAEVPKKVKKVIVVEPVVEKKKKVLKKK